MATELLNPPTELQDEADAPRLAVRRDEAMKSLKALLDRGVALRHQRIRSAAELEKAREAKGEWTQLVNTILNQMFDTDSVSAEFNSWSGKILPEFAGLTQFVERFYEEMDFRVRTVHAVMKRVAVGHYPPKQKYDDDNMEELEVPASPTLMEAVEEAAEQAAEKAVEKVVDRMPSPLAPPAPATPHSPPMPLRRSDAKNCVLVVHTRSEEVEKAISEFAAKLGFSMASIFTTPDDGKAMMNKIANAAEGAFAIILAGEDEVNLARGKNDTTVQHTHRRGAFELGYLTGRVGSQRVCVLHTVDTGLFHDEYGILYVPVDPADGWQLQLARQLRRSGLEVDLNRLC